MIDRWIHVALVVGLLMGGSVAMAAPADAATDTKFKNCTALQKRYKHGVARKGAKDEVRGSTKPVTAFAVNSAVYNANKSLDRDQDGVACEKR